MENKDKETFNYTYSAKEQEEIKAIRKKYAVQEKTEDKMEQLRRLDRSVTEKGTVISIVLGVLGTLILGLGMSCALVWQGTMFLPGIIIGLAGIGILASAYPVYNHVTRKERERIAPEILRLTDELLK